MEIQLEVQPVWALSLVWLPFTVVPIPTKDAQTVVQTSIEEVGMAA